MYSMRRFLFAEIKVGDSAELERVLQPKDIELFAVMSGDINPAHVDLEYAQSDIFRGFFRSRRL